MTIEAEDPTLLHTTNRAWLFLDLEKRPTVEIVPIVMVAGKRWQVSDFFEGQTIDDPDPIIESIQYNKPAPSWRVADWAGNELQVEPFFNGTAGVIYLQHYFWNPACQMTRVSVPNSYRMKVWVNGVEKKKSKKIIPCRPAFWGDMDPDMEWRHEETGETTCDHVNTCHMELPDGWNHILIKLERGNEPIDAYFTLATLLECHGMDTVEQTRFPWDVPEPGYDKYNYPVPAQTGSVT